eukprot:scaffold208_cov323-Pavlova_lutheri.AAC.7
MKDDLPRHLMLESPICPCFISMIIRHRWALTREKILRMGSWGPCPDVQHACHSLGGRASQRFTIFDSDSLARFQAGAVRRWMA